MVIFLLRILPKIKSIKSLSHFMRIYVKFFTKPILFVIINNVIARLYFCYMKRKFGSNRKFILFGSICPSFAIFVETPNRAKDLSVFLLKDSICTMSQHISHKFGINKEKMKEMLYDFITMSVFGLLFHVMLKEKKLVSKS